MAWPRDICHKSDRQPETARDTERERKRSEKKLNEKERQRERGGGANEFDAK